MDPQGGLIGAFGTKVRVAYAFGLLPEKTHDDLGDVREIGNHCAHKLEVKSFDESQLREWCRNFYVAKHPNFFLDEPARNSPREVYNIALAPDRAGDRRDAAGDYAKGGPTNAAAPDGGEAEAEKMTPQ